MLRFLKLLIEYFSQALTFIPAKLLKIIKLVITFH
jgi:hypothetical protein